MGRPDFKLFYIAFTMLWTNPVKNEVTSLELI